MIKSAESILLLLKASINQKDEDKRLKGLGHVGGEAWDIKGNGSTLLYKNEPLFLYQGRLIYNSLARITF